MKWTFSALLSGVCFDEVLFSNLLMDKGFWFFRGITSFIYEWKLLVSSDIRHSRRNWEFASYSRDS